MHLSCRPACLLLAISLAAPAGEGLPAGRELQRRLRGFDAHVARLARDWNAPGLAVGVVAGDRLVFAKGYGFRDVEKRLPFTPATLFPIASNTKLFTAVAAGMLVEEGMLAWDQPIRERVPSIRFWDDRLDAQVTLRDMLAHRTGVTRHDLLWYKSGATRQDLFERLRYLKPREPLRQTFLYNNVMYAAVERTLGLWRRDPAGASFHPRR
jgi:CubicO group peptidase (beta-lactamase class C family)